MRVSTAVWLASLDNGKAFPNIGATGGTLWGMPVITSASAPTDTNSPSETVIALVDAAEILYAEGTIEIKIANHATIEMSDAPDSPPTASTTMVSLWQHDLLALMCEQISIGCHAEAVQSRICPGCCIDRPRLAAGD